MASKVGENVCNKNVQHIGKFSGRGLKASKRVVAPQEQGESTRVTRQRTAANPSLAIVTHDALASTNTTTSQNEEHINNNDEGALFASAQHVPRGKYMGKELDALNRGLGTKIKIDIAEGNRRPKAPMQAAKLASEAGISPRLHTPIFPHWKEYKKEHNKHLVEAYIGKDAITFDMDTKSEAVQAACVDMLKGGQRQMRYRLKKKYFDGVPANLVRTTSPVTCMTDDQWRALVEMWSNPKHKKQEKYKDTEPTAIDLFKEMHCSKKSGFCEPVKNAIAAMEAIEAEPMQEGQQSMSSIEIVSKVLPKSSTFLQNVGLPTSKPSSRSAVSSQVRELQAQLEAKEQESAQLKQESTQLKQELASQAHEIDNLEKGQQETHALLRQLINFNQGQVTPPQNL